MTRTWPTVDVTTISHHRPRPTLSEVRTTQQIAEAQRVEALQAEHDQAHAAMTAVVQNFANPVVRRLSPLPCQHQQTHGAMYLCVSSSCPSSLGKSPPLLWLWRPPRCDQPAHDPQQHSPSTAHHRAAAFWFARPTARLPSAAKALCIATNAVTDSLTALCHRRCMRSTSKRWQHSRR